MKDYIENRRWSDAYLPEVKRHLAQHLIAEAPDALDWRQATDLVTLDAKDRRVAVRIRRPGYCDLFPHDFTIRSGLPSGAQTELAKIVNGYGDWMFYGHADEWGGLARWWLLDLRAFRAALIRRATNGFPLVMGERTNPDGSRFVWFDVRSFPAYPPLVVATSN